MEEKTKRAHNDKKKYERSMHVRTSITMDVAKRFVDRDKFYLPWSLTIEVERIQYHHSYRSKIQTLEKVYSCFMKAL